MIGAVLEAWRFDPSSELSEVVALADERRVPPSFCGALLSTRGDALTLQLVEGAPSTEPDALYYVRGHGAFVLARREEWPARTPGGPPRLLLTLLAVPQPEAALPHHVG